MEPGVSTVRPSPYRATQIQPLIDTSTVLHEYMTKLWKPDYPGYVNRKYGWAANIPSVVAFLDSNEPAWSNDTELHRLDRKVAKMMNDTWNTPVYDEHKDSVQPTFDRILYQALRNFTDGYGHFCILPMMAACCTRRCRSDRSVNPIIGTDIATVICTINRVMSLVLM